MQLEREGSPPPGLRLPQAKLSRKSNQVARGRIGGSNPICPASQSVSIASQRTVAQKPRGTAWFRGGKEDFKKAWISIEWMNGCLNNSTKDAARALPDTTFGCGNPPSTTAVLPRADLGFTCRRKSLGTDQALRSSDQDVAAQREHAAGSDGCAVDRGDDRLFAFHDGVEALSDEPVVPWIGSSRTARANCQRGRSSTLPTLRQIRPNPLIARRCCGHLVQYQRRRHPLRQQRKN